MWFILLLLRSISQNIQYISCSSIVRTILNMLKVVTPYIIIRATKTSRPSTRVQPQYGQSRSYVKLCERARNEYKVNYQYCKLTYKHRRGIDKQRTHTWISKDTPLNHMGWIHAPGLADKGPKEWRGRVAGERVYYTT